MRSASHIEIVLPTGSTDQADARAFLQDRIALWAHWVFVLSSGFYIINLLMWSIIAPDRAYSVAMRHSGAVLHLSASLAFGAVWLIARSQRRFSLRGLRVLEGAALIVGCGLFAAMGLRVVLLRQALGQSGEVGLYAGLLAAISVVMARAIAVPSTASRTFWLSAVALLPMVPDTIWATRGDWPAAITVANWCAVTIAIATIGSRIIFGLRTEAARVRRLGQYTLEEKIGMGGMGMVYRASHAMLRRPTAIKLLPPERAGDANLARFEREVQLTAQLSHPNTVAIYDYGRTPEGVFYYAMEYLDGVNLEDLVRAHGPLPPGRVISILVQVCGALAEAHGRGLVHRDIKPANIILTERGGEPDVAKVVDFGLVKPLESATPGVTVSGASVLTGTPLYMSPEALTLPEASDPRSDLYAVGAVGYFLLTGHPVFEGKSVAEIIGHHLHTEPSAPSKRVYVAAPAHMIPPELDAAILKCLRKNAEDRYPDARTLRDELRRCRVLQPWTADDAAAWWRTFRDADSPTMHRDRTPTGAMTVNVDVDDRLTQAVTRY
jgi:eukaryotic-like serine/threonine-protein kinase